MRRLMQFVAIMTFLTGIALAVVAQPPAQPGGIFVPWANKFLQKENTPAVIVHDFGMVPHGTMLTHKMTITNIYDVPIQVIGVRESCTCLKAIPPTQVLMPNETAELVLTMNAAKFTGQNAQTFFITFGPQYISTAVIRVQANSRTDVSLNPGQVDFGVVPVGGTPSQSVSVRYSGRVKDWAITGIAAQNGPIDVNVSQPSRNESRITVALKPGASGNVDETVLLKTNDPQAPILQLHVSAIMQSSITVSPQRIQFDPTKIGTEQSLKVVVRGSRPFRINAMTDQGDGITVETFPSSAPVQIVTVRFNPKVAGAISREIRLPTSLDGATANIQVEGSGVE